LDDPGEALPSGDVGDDAEPDLPEEAGESFGLYNAEWSDRYRLAREYLFGSDNVERDFAEAYRLFIEEASSGNALAMCDLGRMHKDELIQQAEIESAGGESGPASRWWYAKALAAFLAIEDEKPCPYIGYRIGKLHAAGDGTDQDYYTAAEWFQKAA
jgi:TPR repeat protein